MACRACASPCCRRQYFLKGSACLAVSASAAIFGCERQRRNTFFFCSILYQVVFLQLAMSEVFSNGSAAVASLQGLKEQVSGERKTVSTVVLLAGMCMHRYLAHTATFLYAAASLNLQYTTSAEECTLFRSLLVRREIPSLFQ